MMLTGFSPCPFGFACRLSGTPALFDACQVNDHRMYVQCCMAYRVYCCFFCAVSQWHFDCISYENYDPILVELDGIPKQGSVAQVSLPHLGSSLYGHDGVEQTLQSTPESSILIPRNGIQTFIIPGTSRTQPNWILYRKTVRFGTNIT